MTSPLLTFLALAFGLLLPWGTGLALMLLIPGALAHKRAWPWTITIALPLGIILHTLLASLILLLTPGWMHPAQIVLPELALAAGAVWLACNSWRTRHPVGAPVRPHFSPIPLSPLHAFAAQVLNFGFFALLGILLGLTIHESTRFPQGYYDAWHIWNFKARLIAEGGPHWRWYLQAQEGVMSHQEYPIGFPVFIARLIHVKGAYVPILTQSIAIGCAALWPMLIWSATLKAKGWFHAGCFGLLALAFPFAMIQCAWQYADGPLAALLAAAIAWHYLMCRPIAPPSPQGFSRPCGSLSRLLNLTPGTPLRLAVFGTLLGSLLWTKNEGLVMAGLLLALTTTHDLLRLGIRAAASRLVPTAAALAPFALLHIYLKLAAPESTDLIKDHTIDKQIAALTDTTRFKIIWDYLVLMAIEYINLLALLIGVLAVPLLGVDHRASRAWLPALYTLALLGIAAAYTLTFVFTPYDLYWHLSTAMSRLMVQLWPAAILILALWTYPIDRLKTLMRAI